MKNQQFIETLLELGLSEKEARREPKRKQG
jgi:hypothetical protein